MIVSLDTLLPSAFSEVYVKDASFVLWLYSKREEEREEMDRVLLDAGVPTMILERTCESCEESECICEWTDAVPHVVSWMSLEALSADMMRSDRFYVLLSFFHGQVLVPDEFQNEWESFTWVDAQEKEDKHAESQ